jgi:hypothetical protein
MFYRQDAQRAQGNDMLKTGMASVLVVRILRLFAANSS